MKDRKLLRIKVSTYDNQTYNKVEKYKYFTNRYLYFLQYTV